MHSRAYSTPQGARQVVVALVVVLSGLFVAGCDADEPEILETSRSALVDSLPDDGELGEGWVRTGEPSVGAAAQASTICGVRLNAGMIEGAKVDLADDRDDFVSMYFRRYADTGVARTAFGAATEKITNCPPNGVDPEATVSVATIPDPQGGDQAFGAVLSLSATDSQLPGEFGWALVQTGDVVRSLQFFPMDASGSTGEDLGDLARAVAVTE